MKTATFQGGVHPSYFKELTSAKPIRAAQDPVRVAIPLHQHTGAPCEPLVKAGDYVKVGQRIGDSGARLTAPVHSSVSGKVEEIAPRPVGGGMQALCVVIQSDGMNTLHEEVILRQNVDEFGPEQLKGIIRDAGIVGLGGAAFPTHFKLTPPPGEKFDTFVLNGAECEPYLTADHRVMVERPQDVVAGLRVLMRAAEVRKAIIGIEANKPDAISALEKALSGEKGISVVPLDVKYPQGAEKQLIKTLLDREVPSGGLPVHVGVVVNNAGTAVAVWEAVKLGMPLVERVVTVTGACIGEPQNLRVKIGTLVSEIIEQCGGFTEPPAKIIIGGPMMGVAQYTTDIPVVKGTSGILALSNLDVEIVEPLPCIRCGRCIEACPMGLMPLFINACAEKGRFEQAEEYRILDCIECGCCSFVCPSQRRLVQSIRYAKSEILARRKK